MKNSIDRTDIESSPAYPASRSACPIKLAPLVDKLREERPVSRVTLWDGTQPWLVSRYSDVRDALRDPRLSSDPRSPGYPFVTPVLKQLELMGGEPISFVRMDPPAHTRQRRMLAREFTAGRAEKRRTQVEAVVSSLLDDIIAVGPPADLLEELALPLPMLVLCQLFGVPYENYAYFLELSKVILNLTSSQESLDESLGDMVAHVDRLVTNKAAHPSDDLLGNLVTDYEIPGMLTHQETVNLVLTLLIGGVDTTASALALGLLELLLRRDQWVLLLDHPELVPAAVEEMLRLHSVAATDGMPRAAKEDLEIAGVTIKEGEGLLLNVAAANRDPRVFRDPDRFDIRRKAEKQLTFGYGIHQCIGQWFARIEMQSALTELLRRLPDLRVSKPLEELSFRHNMLVYGLDSLPVEW
ncbi:cytochrome P450 [Streptomyces sp. NPDC006476]|uniref:cytochrome P450 n=1 Tax=Streptomyces sp. NPDC006476 TaxID=3157175 RepID=UPI00339F9E66